MQTTLLAIAIAVILALVAALIGPYLIDWTAYRAAIEAQASRLAGVPVRLPGAIEIRLLPVPSLTAGQVEMAHPAVVGVRELRIEFSFAPLLRGEWRATEVRLVGPVLTLTLDGQGRLSADAPFAGLKPDSVSIERLSIEDAHARVLDPDGSLRLAVEKAWFAGELKSLLGPVRGEGGFVADGERYGYRLNISRPDESGARARLIIDATASSPSLDMDGSLRFEAGVPQFEGRITVAGPSLQADKTGPELGWRATAMRVRAGPNRAVSEDFELQYGPDDRAIKLNGVAEFAFAKKPRVEAILSARRADLDKLLAPSEGRVLSPLDAIQALARSWARAPIHAIPTRIGISIDGLTAGGAQLQNVRADLASLAEGWDIERLELRGPGKSKIRLSGVFAVSQDGIAYEGPAQVDATDPALLSAWLEGRAGVAGAASPMSASGTIVVKPDRMAVEDLNIRIDRKAISGRMLYVRAAAEQRARLEAELKAHEVDLDALYSSLVSVFGRGAQGFPGEVRLALDLGAAQLFGTLAKSVSANLALDKSSLAIDRLSIGDLGGAKLTAKGGIAEPFTAPHGSVTFDLAAGKLDGLLAVLAKVSPAAAERIRQAEQRLVPVQGRLHVSVQRNEGARAASAQLGLEGRAGSVRIGVIGDATGELTSLASATWRFDGRVEADEGPVLATLFGLDRFAAFDRRPAWARLVAEAEEGGGIRVDARIAGGGLDASAKGVIRGLEAERLAGALDIAISASDARPLLTPAATGQSGAALPFLLKTKLVLHNRAISADDMRAVIAGAAAHGNINVELGVGEGPAKVKGRVEADLVDATLVLARLAGAGSDAAASARWSFEPFKPLLGNGVIGELELKAARVPLSATLVARNLRATIRAQENAIVFDALEGSLGGGRITGRLAMDRSPGGLGIHSTFALEGADVLLDTTADTRQRFAGTISLRGELEGRGLSPATLVGSLSGSAALSIERADLAGLDARAFETVIRAVDRGAPLDAARVGEIVAAAFNAGRLAAGKSEGTLALSAGQIRISPIAAGPDGALEASGVIDLVEGQVDVRLSLRGSPDPAVASRPELIVSLLGPVGAVRRTTDVSPLVAWLTLRAVEKQTKQLQNLEATRAREEEAIRALEQKSLQQRLEQKSLEQRQSEQSSGPVSQTSSSPGGAAEPVPSSPSPTHVRRTMQAAPPLPPPIDIRPMIGQERKEPRPPPRPSSGALPKEKQAADPSTLRGRGVFDPLFNTQR